MTLLERIGSEHIACACAQCGAPLEVPNGKTMTVTLIGSSGKPNARAVVVEGEEIHRCEPQAGA
jgi:hypothetical protein